MIKWIQRKYYTHKILKMVKDYADKNFNGDEDAAFLSLLEDMEKEDKKLYDTITKIMGDLYSKK